MPIQFIPQSLWDQISELPVRCIYALGFNASLVDPRAGSKGPKTNHWVLHLAISETEAIRLDPSPDGKGQLVLIVSRKGYVISRNAIKTVQLNTAEKLTVGNVLNYLGSSNYTSYQFSESGQGCRYWIYSVAHLFLTGKYLINEKQVQALNAMLQVVWNERGKVKDEEQSGIVPGKFSA